MALSSRVPDIIMTIPARICWFMKYKRSVSPVPTNAMRRI
jgi:hypothetical protein